MENVGKKAQVIILAGFLLAIGVIAVTLVLNGLIFSQDVASRDDGVPEKEVDRIAQRGGGGGHASEATQIQQRLHGKCELRECQGTVRLVSGGQNVEVEYNNVTDVEDAGDGIEIRAGRNGGSMRIRYNESQDRILIE